ncbi:hypothetical protein CALVIDRAFT_540483 [Calocera viscosa TUFC12733]|uniref:Secreted protein n=1 Tax=Calocera viscosa (strain TUFC12733) TaxID=1330018 RepID=A0A167IVW7_CALVF|nr:hypothetical protein CALVIDRAFT_540483 [Calocera viscosa TUFC12733]
MKAANAVFVLPLLCLAVAMEDVVQRASGRASPSLSNLLPLSPVFAFQPIPTYTGTADATRERAQDAAAQEWTLSSLCGRHPHLTPRISVFFQLRPFGRVCTFCQRSSLHDLTHPHFHPFVPLYHLTAHD